MRSFLHDHSVFYPFSVAGALKRIIGLSPGAEDSSCAFPVSLRATPRYHEAIFYLNGPTRRRVLYREWWMPRDFEPLVA